MAFLQRLIRFLVAGTSAAAVNILILYILVQYLHFHYLISAVLSYLGSLGAGFALQKFWAFRDHSSHATNTQFARYTTVTLINLCMNTVLMYVLVSLLGIWYIAAQILCGVAIAISSYLLFQRFVFKQTQ